MHVQPACRFTCMHRPYCIGMVCMNYMNNCYSILSYNSIPYRIMTNENVSNLPHNQVTPPKRTFGNVGNAIPCIMYTMYTIRMHGCIYCIWCAFLLNTNLPTTGLTGLPTCMQYMQLSTCMQNWDSCITVSPCGTSGTTCGIQPWQVHMIVDHLTCILCI